MNLKDYARAMRYYDWTACMSDDGRKFRAATKRMGDLKMVAEESPNHRRVFDLARGWHGNFMWWKPTETCSEADRFEDGWRWVGAYCWVHGLKLTEDEAKALVEPMGTRSEYNPNTLITGYPRWTEIDKRLKEAS